MQSHEDLYPGQEEETDESINDGSLDEETQTQLLEHMLGSTASISGQEALHSRFNEMTYDEASKSIGRWFMIGIIGR
jgi:hypothetical protein